jgi:hypothetical protein
VAFQDAVEDSLRYLTGTAGAILGIEMVDDGIRSADRNHPVGAASAVVVEPSGGIAVVYQDAAQSDLLFARRDGAGVWTHGDLLAGEPGYGFYNAAVSEGGQVWVATFGYDREKYPPGEVWIANLP